MFTVIAIGVVLIIAMTTLYEFVLYRLLIDLQPLGEAKSPPSKI
jgi:hypothetical protein